MACLVCRARYLDLQMSVGEGTSFLFSQDLMMAIEVKRLT